MNPDCRQLAACLLRRGWLRMGFLAAISGTGLQGSALDSPAAAQRDEVVKLPPFVVNELPDDLPWRYGRVAEIEVLTLASDRLTEAFLASAIRGKNFMSRAFFGERTLPVSFVLFDHRADLLATVAISQGGSRWRAGTTEFAGHVSQSDGDVLTIAANLHGVSEWPMVGTELARRLTAEASDVPRWLSEGLFGSSGCLSQLCGYPDRPAIDLSAFLWISEEVSQELREKRFRPPKLLPMERFFASTPNPEKDPETYRLWSSQAGLFVRWQLFGKNGRPLDPVAFWGFALEARTHPVNEPMFHRWFKLSYAEAENEMLRYLRVAVAAPETIQVANVNRPVPELSNLTLRMATEEQVARLKGNFEAMEARRLRHDFPELAAKYAAAARRTLQHGLKANPASGELRGLFGQLEYDQGHADAARPLLEYAFAQAVLGTRALLSLAKLRLDESRQGLPADAKLPGGALERVLTPLFVARARKPPALEVYQMIAAVWAQSAVTPTRRHLAVLLEGAQLFRDETDYIISAVDLHRRHGYAAEANALLALGETWARDETARARYAALRAVGNRLSHETNSLSAIPPIINPKQ